MIETCKARVLNSSLSEVTILLAQQNDEDIMLLDCESDNYKKPVFLTQELFPQLDPNISPEGSIILQVCLVPTVLQSKLSSLYCMLPPASAL